MNNETNITNNELELALNLDLDTNDIISTGNEIEDKRITPLIDECVRVKLVKNLPQDIYIDYIKLLDMKDLSDNMKEKVEYLGSINIKRRFITGKKYYSFLKDIKVIISKMNQEEIQTLLRMRTLCENWHKYNQKKIDNTLNDILLIFANFVNEFINHVDPIAYTPKCKVLESKNLQELFFSEEHLIYLVKIIVISKITLLFTDNVEDKQLRSDAKKYIARKIWNISFVEGDKKLDMKSKIHKLVTSRFVSTEYNEARFWAAAKLANINSISQANLINNNLQTDNILMLSIDANPLSFLDVFLKNTIYFLSKRKFQFEYVLNNFEAQSNVMQSEISTETKFTPLENKLMKLTVDNFIKNNVMKLIQDKSEIDTFSNNFKKNIFHFWIVVPYISRLININPLYLCSVEKDKFILLTLFTYYKMINLKCFTMASLVKSNMKSISTGCYNENIKNMSVVIARFLKSEALMNFISSNQINDNIIDVSKLVINPLICMTMNQYFSFDDELIQVQSSDIVNEYIKFLNHFMTLK